MISLEQIRTLDERVKKAVQALGDLRSENQTLKQKLADYQKRIEELEKLIDNFKKDQGEIEPGILNAISQLETLETSEETGSGAAGEPGGGIPLNSETAGSGISAGMAESSSDEGAADAESTGHKDAAGGEIEAAPDGPPASAPEDDSEDSDEKELDIF